MKEPFLYEDEYCAIDKTALYLKWFYFPTAGKKTIKFGKIIGVYYEEQNFKGQLFKVKGWGMSCSPCWWGCDAIRNCHSKDKHLYNVVIDCGESTYKGFTTQDINAFLSILRPLLLPECILQEKLPF